MNTEEQHQSVFICVHLWLFLFRLEPNMKYVVAVIQPDRLNEVLDELERREVHLVTVVQVMGRGRQRGLSEIYRGHKEVGSLLRKVKLEIAINDEFLERTIEAITATARTGQIGDGKIFVHSIDHAVRIRTGETDADAL
jgi:nitrogen regulatory protein P-II 2